MIVKMMVQPLSYMLE